MLALTRRRREVIRIGDDIYVTVLSIRGGQVRLGIEAPRDLRIERCDNIPPLPRPSSPATDPSANETTEASSPEVDSAAS